MAVPKAGIADTRSAEAVAAGARASRRMSVSRRKSKARGNVDVDVVS